MPAAMRRVGSVTALGAIGIVLWLAAWQGLALMLDRQQSRMAAYVSTPGAVFGALIGSLTTATTWTHLGATALFSLVGLAVAAVIAIPTGLAMGRFRGVEGLLRPLVDMFRVLPSAAIIPVATILLRSNGWDKKVSVIAFGSLWPMLVSTWDAVAHLPGQFVDTLRVLHVTRITAMWLSLRRALPSILSGVRISAGVSLILAITIELFEPGELEHGVGRMILSAQTNGEHAQMYAAIMLLMLLGYTLHAGMQRAASFFVDGPEAARDEGMPAVREAATSYLPESLHSLPEWVLRVLTADQVTETLWEIYGDARIAFRVLTNAERAGVVERSVMFSVQPNAQPVVWGQARIDVAAMTSELVIKQRGWEEMAAAIAQGSLGPSVRRLLGARVEYLDLRLDVLSSSSGLASTLDDKTAPILSNGVIAVRERRMCSKETGRTLVAILEYVAVDALAACPPR